ncbi:ABC transporter permease subunit [Paenibacillus sp. J5C_2022]|nr:ABC transporter permease subunit [Paenibacillus sp. J5C2022]
MKKNISLYVMFAPVLLYFIIFSYWPMNGVLIAFQDYLPTLGIFGSPWVGFDNFKQFFSSFYFDRILTNTIGISLYNIVVTTPVPIVLALMFHELRRTKLKNVMQTITFAPNFISVTVVCGMVLLFLNPDNGIINGVIKLFGGEAIDFMANPDSFWHVYVWSGVWQYTGWVALIYTATMAGIDSSLYEAAEIDGAGRFAKVIHVTLPSIIPTIVLMFILNLGNVMNVGFEKVLLLQNDLNLSSSEIIATYIYKRGLLATEYGLSSAVGVFNNVINFALLLVANTVSKRVSDTSLW